MHVTLTESPSRRGKRLAIAAIAALATLATTALPAGAEGVEVINTSFRGDMAHAGFSSSEGCIGTRAIVGGMDGRVNLGPGRPEVTSAAFVGLSRYDFCTNELLLDAIGTVELADDAFRIDRELTTATLIASVEVSDDVSGTTFPVHVNVAWTGDGDLVRVKDHRQITTPGFRLNLRFNGSERQGIAQGTITDGASEYAGSADWASLRSVKSADLVVVR